MTTIRQDEVQTQTVPALGEAVLRELRPKQWTKNGLVFAALVFSHHLFEPAALLRTLAAFAAFCAVSSGTYVINDLVDIEQDRRHPVKRLRPLASGALSEGAGRALAAALLVAAFAGAFALSWRLGLVLVAYLGVALAYSFRLKHLVLLDVFAIAAGFVLRAVAGTAVLAVQLSSWLLVCTVLLSLFLALAKRRHEVMLLAEEAAGHRQILGEYSQLFLDQLIAVVTSSTVIAYSLYTFTGTNLPRDDRSMMFTIPFVLYALFRYLYLIYQRNEGGSPETLLLRDRPLLVAIMLWGLASIVVLYRPWA